jgi:hypothetical protein
MRGPNNLHISTFRTLSVALAFGQSFAVPQSRCFFKKTGNEGKNSILETSGNDKRNMLYKHVPGS